MPFEDHFFILNCYYQIEKDKGNLENYIITASSKQYIFEIAPLEVPLQTVN